MTTSYAGPDVLDNDLELDQTQDPKAKNKYTPSDNDLAERWLIRYKRITAWVDGFKRYEKITGIWRPAHEDVIRREIKTIIANAKSEGVKTTSRLLNSVCELIRVEISIEPEKWRMNPDYLPCKNGVLHIPTRTLLPHTPDIYATSGLNFDYDPTATAPAFQRVLQQIPKEAPFLQEYAGYALTTDISLETALWLYGPKGSGKSTVIVGLQNAWGTRAGLLGLADIERSRFALTQLPDKTLVVSTEQPNIYMKASYILNAIISGEAITVERKYFDAVEITPYAKVIWSMNRFPHVNDPDDGIMRRVKVIKFPSLPESQRDPKLKEQVKTEGAGILNWALEGLERLNLRGRFDPPKSVLDATKDFQEKNDIPSLFLDDVGAKIDLTNPNYRTQSQTLYNRYSQWCRENGHIPLSSTKMAEEWERLGFVKRNPGGVKFWLGVHIP